MPRHRPRRHCPSARALALGAAAGLFAAVATSTSHLAVAADKPTRLFDPDELQGKDTKKPQEDDPKAPPAGTAPAPPRIRPAPMKPTPPEDVRPATPPVAPPVAPPVRPPPVGPNPPVPIPPVPAKPPGSVRPAVPAAAAVGKADAMIKEIFKAEYARKGTAAQRALGRALWNEATQSGDDPASLYLLLREARDQAAAGGDADVAVAAARGIRNAFRPPAPDADGGERAALLAAARALLLVPPPPPGPAGHATAAAQAGRDDARRAVELLCHQAERDAAAGDVAGANALLLAAEPLAPRVSDPTLVDRLRFRRATIQATAADREKAVPALAAADKDPASASVAGRYLLARGGDDLPRAVALLAAGAEPALKAAAARELSAAARPGGADAAELVAVGDAWAEAGKTQPGSAASGGATVRDAAFRRAGTWYEAAAARDPSGLLGVAARKKVADMRTLRLRRGGLTGEYYRGMNFQRRAFVRLDDELTFKWNGERPAVDLPGEFFSARWSGYLKGNPGACKLVLVWDDKVRVWFDGLLVLDRWNEEGAFRKEVPVSLTGAFQEVRVEYSQGNGQSKFGLGWVPPAGGKPRAIPLDMLFYDPLDTGPVFAPPVRPDASGNVTLGAAAAQVYPSSAVGLKFTTGQQKDRGGFMGWWNSAGTWPQWEFEVAADAEYAIDLRYANGGDGGAQYVLCVGQAAVPVSLPRTGGWESYRTTRLGTVRLAPGPQTLALKAVLKEQSALANVCDVVLTPVR